MGFGVVFGSGTWADEPRGIRPWCGGGQPDDGECGAEEISPTVQSRQATGQTGGRSRFLYLEKRISAHTGSRRITLSEQGRVNL
jgi:hypothetical protein